MYLAIDIGGTKTLLAAFDEHGRPVKEHRFKTGKKYSDFITQLQESLAEEFASFKFKACCCAVPGEIDHKTAVGLVFGNLPWKNVPIGRDLEKILGNIPILVENDAKLAGLSEDISLHEKYKKVIYLTISTGIGIGIIINGVIDADLADSEVGQMVLEHDGKLQKWEDFASGRALVARYGKKAKDINDPVIWEAFAANLARGINALLATIQPDAVILGGSVGNYFERFRPYLISELEKMENDMVKVPPILKAKHPEEAVIYGCYALIRQKIG